MDEDFFKQLRNISREDEMRPKLLMRGVKIILEEKKNEGLLKKFFYRKKPCVEPASWN
jgi:hypothetical protein